MSEKFIVSEQRELDFYGDTITVVRLEDGNVMIPIRPICDALGVAWNGQRERINRDPVLSKKMGPVTVERMEGSRKVSRDLGCLPLSHLNGWLFGLNANRVKESVRGKLIRYQEDCYEVLADAFGRNQVTARPLSTDMEELLQHSDDPTAVAYRHAMAIANLAREQMLFKVQAEGRMDSAEARIDAIEAQLGNPDHQINNSQQMEITQAVKAISHELGKRSGRNEFGGVYGELYRRFEIASYKQLPTAKHSEAMQFLSDWYSRVTGTELPF